MRPVRIEMDGFGAFRERTVVDLDDADFFALVGPTGSGKSTVLDAVCFALYGSVPRYDHEGLITPVLSVGATEGRVSLRFESGGQTYVATRVLRRQRDKVTTKEQRLERVIGDTTEVLASGREVSSRVEQVVGLSFTHFTKCVLLPQGEFARFLHDTPAERQEVLVKLLDLGVYAAMAKAANGRAAQAEVAAKVAASRREDLGDVGDAVVATAAARVTAVAVVREQVAAAADVVARLDDEVREVTTAGRDTRAHLGALARVAVSDEAAGLGDELRRAGAELVAAQEAEEEARAAVGAADAALAALPPLDELTLAAAAHRDLTAALAARPEAVATHARRTAEAAAAAGARDAAEAQRAAAVAAGEAEVASADAAVAAAEAVLAACVPTEVLTLATHRRGELAAAVGERSKLERDVADASVQAGAAASKAAAADVAYASARATREAAETTHAAHVVAGRLVVGEACPACGVPVAELPPGTGALPSLDAVRAAEAASDKERSAAHQLAVAAAARLDAQRERAAALDASIARLRGELGPYLDEAVLEAASAARRAASDALREVQAARDRARAAAAAARDANDRAVAAATAAVTAASTGAAGAEAALTALDARIAELRAAVAARPDAEAVDAEIGRVTAAAAAVRSARRAADDARRVVDARRSAVAAAEAALVAARQAFDEQRMGVAPLDPPTPSAGGDLVDDWRALHAWAVAKAAELETAIDGLRARLQALQAQRQVQHEQVLVAATAAGVAVPTGADLATLRDAVTAHAQRVGGELERLHVARARAAELAEEESARRAEATVAADLARLLNARNFEKWLVSTALRVLVEGASEVLRRLSGGAYSLTLDGADDFAVVDHRNADEVRPARTLSGGETFQASLALALALAEQLQGLSADPNRRLEAIFLDEGFGTLDPDTLETVAATIETLGADGRMVGIVTHVRDLAERVPVRYVVTRGARSSTVERVEL